MVAGWDLNSGELNPKHFEDQEFWKVFNVLYSTKSKNTTSYKFGLIKSIIENLYNTNSDSELTFDQINYSFTRIYWNLIVTCNLKQSGQRASIESVLLSQKEKYLVPNELLFDQIKDEFQLEILKQVRPIIKKYVFGALFTDTEGKLFGFDKKQERLYLNESACNFMKRHQSTITSLTNYHFAKYLEKINSIPEVYSIIGKVENLSKRNSLHYYLNILSRHDEMFCFYCQKLIKPSETNNVHVDHFIPWSFVQADHLWNLVLSCKTCNLSKSDHLAESPFLWKLINRNEILLNKNEKVINNNFNYYTHQKIESLYSFSIDNGHKNLWVPRHIF